MAYGNNTNTPGGLRPIRIKASATNDSQTSQYNVLTAQASSIFTYDPATYDAGNTGTLIPCPAGTASIGVIMGFNWYDATGKWQFSKYWPGGTATQNGSPVICDVLDDPSIIFDIQVSNFQNTAPTFLTVSAQQATNAGGGGPYYNFGKNANWAVGGGSVAIGNPTGGSTATGLSAYYLDYNTVVTGNATRNLKILQFTQFPTNTVAGNQSTVALYNNVLVKINNHILSGGTGTVGV